MQCIQKPASKLVSRNANALCISGRLVASLKCRRNLWRHCCYSRANMLFCAQNGCHKSAQQTERGWASGMPQKGSHPYPNRAESITALWVSLSRDWKAVLTHARTHTHTGTVARALLLFHINWSITESDDRLCLAVKSCHFWCDSSTSWREWFK